MSRNPPQGSRGAGEQGRKGSPFRATQIVRRFVGTTVALLAIWLPGPPVSAEAGAYRAALPGYAFSYPRDHYAHEDFRTEWWYYTGHLHAQSGEAYGYQVTFFRSGLTEAASNPSRWAAKNLYLAHFAISDIARKSFRYFERVNRAALSQAGASQQEFHVWIADWSASGDGKTQRVRARESEFAVDLALDSEKPPVIHGQNGVSQKGEERGHASHYYSLTRLKTEGSLTVRGKTQPVTGWSWMDHEFGSTQLASDQVGWDWFSLQFEDGTELMLYIIRKTDGRPDPYSAGTWVSADGRSTQLRQPEFSIQTLDRWTSPRTRGVYPSKWRLRIPAMDLDVIVTPAFPDQELDTAKSTQVIYWEGAASANGTIAGRPIAGRGYVELTGYAAPFRKRL